LTWTLVFQGELEEALRRDREALALAQRHGEAFSLAWAHYGTGVSRQMFADWAACDAACAEAIRIAEEHGFPYVLGMATVTGGWAWMMQGRPDTGIPMLRGGVAIVDRTGAALMRPSYLGMLAAADVMEGDRRSALVRLDEALGEVQRSGEVFQEAPLLIGKS